MEIKKFDQIKNEIIDSSYFWLLNHVTTDESDYKKAQVDFIKQAYNLDDEDVGRLYKDIYFTIGRSISDSDTCMRVETSTDFDFYQQAQKIWNVAKNPTEQEGAFDINNSYSAKYSRRFIGYLVSNKYDNDDRYKIEFFKSINFSKKSEKISKEAFNAGRFIVSINVFRAACEKFEKSAFQDQEITHELITNLNDIYNMVYSIADSSYKRQIIEKYIKQYNDFLKEYKDKQKSEIKFDELPLQLIVKKRQFWSPLTIGLSLGVIGIIAIIISLYIKKHYYKNH